DAHHLGLRPCLRLRLCLRLRSLGQSFRLDGDQQPNCTARKNVVMNSERSSGLVRESWLKSASGQVPWNCTCRKKQVMNSERSSGFTRWSLLTSAGQGGGGVTNPCTGPPRSTGYSGNWCACTQYE